jgi:hypothetical protein
LLDGERRSSSRGIVFALFLEDHVRKPEVGCIPRVVGIWKSAIARNTRDN